MKNGEISLAAIERAMRWLESAFRAMEDERWDDAIYSFQMAVESALKAIMILFGIEYPKKHDISNNYLKIQKYSIPDWFLKKIEFHSEILSKLVSLRGIAAYGYTQGINKDYFKEHAFSYRKSVEEIIEDCKKLINEFLNLNEI